MAQTSAERQAAYRRNRVTAGPKGDGERRINTWVASGATLALARLAQRYGVTQRVMLERLIVDADDTITATLDPTSPAWAAYFNVTQSHGAQASEIEDGHLIQSSPGARSPQPVGPRHARLKAARGSGPAARG